MAFVGVMVEKGVKADAWIARVMQGFANVKEDRLNLLADRFQMIEADKLCLHSSMRLFLFRSVAPLPMAFWVIGFFAGIAAYTVFLKTWILVLSIFLLFSAVVFTSQFLRFSLRLSMLKAKYGGKRTFLSAEEVIGLAGLRVIADVKEDLTAEAKP